MVLGMARPVKHAKTGVYYLRRRVPSDLVALVGAAVVKQSLGTKDPERARIEFRAREIALDARWAELRKGCQYLDDEQVEALAGEIYADALARFGKVRSFAAANLHWWHVARHAEEVDGTAVPPVSEERREYALGFADVYVDEKLRARGLLVDAETRRRLRFATHRALKQAAALYFRQVEGDWRPDPDVARFPVFVAPSKAVARLEVDAFWKETTVGYAATTVRRWRPILDRLMASAGLTDVTLVTRSHVEAWRDAALATGEVSPRSFKRNDLAAVKTLFGIGVEAKLLASNPAADVKVFEARRTAARDMRGFHEEEAETILRASLTAAPKRVSPHLAAARRWVPWICAYTGARVNEITQTRACDIKRIDGVWCIHITPEAGTEKSGLKRNVPLHEHLLEQGIVEFAQAKVGKARLFAAETGGGVAPSAEITGKKLATWVRSSLKVTDLDVMPNHGWRHRFKTVARGVMQEMFIDALQGHAPKTQSRHYGRFAVETLAVELAKMPRERVVVPKVPAPAPATARKSVSRSRTVSSNHEAKRARSTEPASD